jgi:PKHD-type hydroxylase
MKKDKHTHKDHDAQITSWRFELDKIHPFAWSEKVFTPEQCDEIIKHGSSLFSHKALISGKDKLNVKYRDSVVSWIHPTQEAHWIFDRIVNCVLDLNNKYFNFHLSGLYEGLQFTKYVGPSGRYKKHCDRGYNTPIRKLSFVLQLTDPTEYTGGDLKIYEGEEGIKADKTRGTLIAFPSFFLHEVTPVKKGTRYSLVGWTGGDNFK